MKERFFYFAGAILFLHVATASAFTVDESVDGDLSGIGPLPTELTLESGNNLLTGSMGGGVDFDIFRFTVPIELRVVSILVNDYPVGNAQSFLGIQSGDSWTAGIGFGVSGSSLLGWTLFGFNNLGQDILASANTTGSGASGFDVPLVAGNYVFLLQDTTDNINYGLNFVASPVPLPASLPLFVAAVALLWRRNRGLDSVDSAA